MKNVLRRLGTICLLLILIVSLLPISKSEAVFTADDCPYDIKFTKVNTSYGAEHTLAIDEEGNVWAWGRNNYGQLGNGTTTNSNVPVQTNVTSSTKFKEIAAGDTYSIALDTNGNIWGWGGNNLSQLGNGNTTNQKTPIKITSGTEYIYISAGRSHSFAIDKDGYLWGWGDNTNGNALGDASIYNDSTTYSSILLQNVPIKIMTDKRFSVAISCSSTSFAIDTSGNLYGWGNNSFGRLGTGDDSSVSGVVKIMENTKFQKVSAGHLGVLAIDVNGNLYGWGRQYVLGNSSATSSTQTIVTPTQIKSGTKFTDIATGYYTFFAFDDTGDGFWIWGENSEGQLFRATSVSDVKYMEKNYNDFTKIYGGDSYSVAIDKNGNIWTAGDNTYGKLGDGTTNSSIGVQITASSYTVTLNTNGGTINSGNITSYIEGVGATLPTDVTKTGYTFDGWYESSSLTGTAVTSISTTDTGNKTYYAKWTANTATYKVEHYKQNTTLTGYTLYTTETKSGNVGAVATASAKTYTGFSENTSYSGSIKTGTVAADGSLVLKLYYDRNSYTVTLNTNGGTVNSGNVTSYTYGIGLTLPTDVTKTGHTFNGWYENSSFSGSAVTGISTTDIGNKTYYAKWTGSSNIAYKIEHYKQNVSLSGYTLEDTENKTGTTGETVTATAKSYTGFSENTTYTGRVATGTVAGDGSLVLKLYYDRNSYTVTLNTNGGTVNSGNVTSYTYGIGVTLPTNVTKTGYTFNGWYENSSLTGTAVTSISTTDTGNKTYYAKWTTNQYTVTFKNGNITEKTEIVNYGSSATAPSLIKAGYTLSWDKNFNNVTSDLTVNAIWTANTNTPYKVEHYQRTTDLEVEGYSLFEIENKTGTTDTTVTAAAKTYTGFTENTTYSGRVVTGTIAGDGSLVLKLYYDRNTYNITYNLNGGTQVNTLTPTYIYGKELILSNKVEKQGYTFAGWYDNANLTGTAATKISSTETGDKAFYAKWVKESEYNITLNKYEIQDSYITKVNPNTSVDTFLSNINTNGIPKVFDTQGNEITGSTLVGTGSVLKVEFKGTKHEYVIAVRGDIDGNGKITVTDLSMLNQQIVKKITLTGAKEKAADIDYSGKTTVTDLSMMNQALVGKITL